MEGPRPHADPLVEIVEMVGVKMPPRQEVEGIATIYPPGGEDWQGCLPLLQAVQQGHRPTITADCPEWLANVIRQCWATKPEDRMSAAEVAHAMTNARAGSLLK